MLEQQPIDALRFARTGGEFAGSISIEALPRLVDLLRERVGEVGYTLAGGIDARGRPSIVVAVHGTFVLTCQRCLGPLEYRMDTASTLLLAAADDEMPDPADEEEEADWIDGREPLEIQDLVEQEIVLALPFAPLHDEGRCEREYAMPGRSTAGRESAFAALAGLKGAGRGQPREDIE